MLPRVILAIEVLVLFLQENQKHPFGQETSDFAQNQ
jgi:hypothetical protein